MKKIFTLIAAAFLTVAAFAADRRPVVSLQASKKYEVIIDGQSYFSNSNRSTMSLTGIRNGQHSIKVYEVSRSPFRRFKRLVSASSFQLRRNDIDISVNSMGQISIMEDRYGRDQRDNNWGRNDDHGYDSQNNDQRDNSWGKKDDHGYDNQDRDHRNDKNDRDKRF